MAKPDLELWKAYKYDGDRRAKTELIKRYRPHINAQARSRFGTGTPISPSAIESHGMKQVSLAIDNYDPTKGAALGTHVYNYLLKMGRFVNTFSYPVRPSEDVHSKISEFKEKKDNLRERLGREPNTQELADSLGWPEREVNRIGSQHFEVQSMMYDFGSGSLGQSSTFDDYIDYVRKFELSPQEVYVFDHTTGFNSSEVKKAGEIAKDLGVSPAQVSHIKNAVVKKMGSAFDIGDFTRT